MRNFIKYVVLLIGTLLLLAMIMDGVYSYTLTHGQPRSKLQYILQLKNRHFDLAFFGSSRTENHIDCELMTKLTGKSCINLGISGASPGDMLILMKLMKEQNTSIGKVYMQVDYDFNSSGITKNFKAQLIPFLDNPVIHEQLLNHNEEIPLQDIPFFRYMIFDKVIGIREVVSTLLRMKPNLNLENGFVPVQGVGQNIFGSFPENIVEKNSELEQMKELYDGTSTSILFFTAPYCSKVRNRDFIKKVQAKLPELRNYVDLFKSHPEYFFNCGHLNQSGAEAFTKEVARNLILKN